MSESKEDGVSSEIADAVIERVVNLDEYSSPDDDPDLLLVKIDTLRFIVKDAADALLKARQS